MAKVKICGVNTPEALAAAAEAGADWVGFVFFPRSPRFVTPEQAAAISATWPGGPGRVGLFVEPGDEAVEAALRQVPLAALQIYAGAERARALRTRFGVPVWHAVGIATPADLPAHAEAVDALMLDAKPPPDATRPGGNAASFDWSMLQGWTAPLPWLLAGGLTPDNVAEAIRQSGAAAVDVSSGVEAAPGLKSAELIRRFVAAAKAGSDPAFELEPEQRQHGAQHDQT